MINKVLTYFKKSNSVQNTENLFYDNSQENNYIESFYSITLEGFFKGTIICLGDVLIKKGASFTGNLVCKKCMVKGALTGRLSSITYTEVCTEGFLEADILTGSIFIESQTVARGAFKISKEINIPLEYQKLEVTYQRTLKNMERLITGEELKTKMEKRIVLKPMLVIEGQKIPSQTPVPNILPSENSMPVEKNETINSSSSGWW